MTKDNTNFIDPSKKTLYGKHGVEFWIGKIVGYADQKEQIEEGFGWRYKVRILGDNSDTDQIEDQYLSYATVLLPTTAGTGAAYKLKSVRLSQGDMVFGVRGGGTAAPKFIIGAFPRTRVTKNSSGKFGTLSGFWEDGTLSDTGILSGQFNEQVGPEFLKGLSGLDPKKWTKATATNPSEKVKEIVPSVKKEKNIGIGTGTTDDTTEEFQEITEEDTEKNDVKNNAGKVVDPKEWKPGTPLNTATMEALKESFEKGELPPATWEAALKQASEQGLDGYEEYVIKEEIKKEVEPKKAEYKKTFVEAVNEAKNPPFDSWEKKELAKLADKNEARLLDNGKISISAETGIRFQERTNILKEMNRLEESIKFDTEFEGQTITLEDSTGERTVDIPKASKEKIQEDKARLLYLTKKLKYIEDGGVVKYSGELTG